MSEQGYQSNYFKFFNNDSCLTKRESKLNLYAKFKTRKKEGLL